MFIIDLLIQIFLFVVFVSLECLFLQVVRRHLCCMLGLLVGEVKEVLLANVQMFVSW